jgi:hypothetical protein
MNADDLERDLMAGSQAEHLDTEGCWCRHPRSEHRWDAVRDYRELECLACRVALGEEDTEDA